MWFLQRTDGQRLDWQGRWSYALTHKQTFPHTRSKLIPEQIVRVLHGDCVHDRPCYSFFELANLSIAVSENHKIRRSSDIDALKLWKGRSGLRAFVVMDFPPVLFDRIGFGCRTECVSSGYSLKLYIRLVEWYISHYPNVYQTYSRSYLDSKDNWTYFLTKIPNGILLCKKRPYVCIQIGYIKEEILGLQFGIIQGSIKLKLSLESAPWPCFPARPFHNFLWPQNQEISEYYLDQENPYDGFWSYKIAKESHVTQLPPESSGTLKSSGIEIYTQQAKA